jgi:hypothetical protein
LTKATPKGVRVKLEVGTLFIPEALRGRERVPLFVHFHAAPWLPEVAAADYGRAAVLSIQLGSGSAVYGKAFADPKRFGRLLKEAEAKAGMRFESVGLTAWSAGYGAVRAILRVGEYYDKVAFVLLIDGLHAGYVKPRPESGKPQIITADLDVFLRLARDAAAGKKTLLVTHSEIVPGTYASTTETADYLLRAAGVKRELVPGAGLPRQLSEAKRAKLLVIGYAGATAADHVDQLHTLPEYLRRKDQQ